jgi:hypothetical protein
LVCGSEWSNCARRAAFPDFDTLNPHPALDNGSDSAGFPICACLGSMPKHTKPRGENTTLVAVLLLFSAARKLLVGWEFGTWPDRIDRR